MENIGRERWQGRKGSVQSSLPLPLSLYNLCNATWKKLQERARENMSHDKPFARSISAPVCPTPPLGLSSCTPSYQPQQLRSCICLASLLPPSPALHCQCVSPTLPLFTLCLPAHCGVLNDTQNSYLRLTSDSHPSFSLLIFLHSSRPLWNCRHAPCTLGPLPSREHRKLLAVSGETSMSAFECASESGWKHIVGVLCHWVVKMGMYTIITANFKALQCLQEHFLMVGNMWDPIITITYAPVLRRQQSQSVLTNPLLLSFAFVWGL